MVFTVSARLIRTAILIRLKKALIFYFSCAILSLPHKLNMGLLRGWFLLRQKRILHFAIPVISRKFVWQQTELRFSCVVPFVSHALFILKRKRYWYGA